MQSNKTGPINGNGNHVDQKNYHVQNNYNGNGGGKNSSDSDAGLAVLMVLFGVMIITSFIYLRYYELILLFLRLAVVTVMFLHSIALLRLWQYNDLEPRHIRMPIFGLVAGGISLWLLVQVQLSMPLELLATVKQVTVERGLFHTAINVWFHKLDNIQTQVIMNNLVSAVAIATAILTNFVLSLQVLLAAFAVRSNGRILRGIAGALSAIRTPGVFICVGAFVIAFMFTHNLIGARIA